MDHEWAAQKLKEFHKIIDDFCTLEAYGQSEYLDEGSVAFYDSLREEYGSSIDIGDRLIMLNPVMRTLMDAAQPGLGGNYIEPPEDGWSYNGRYWREIVRPRTLRAIGIHNLGEEARHRMRPDSPELIADHEHGLALSERVALEQLAAFSLLARWIDECEVATAPSPT